MPSIYIAGKIRVEKAFRPIHIGVNSSEYFSVSTKPIDSFFNYSGPYVIDCKHGCRQDESTHGTETFCGEGCIDQAIIYRTCLNQITQSDIFLAWIDEADCYGTIAEIGYAQALGLRPYIAYDVSLKESISDFWFVEQFCRSLGICFSVSQALSFIRHDWEIEIEKGMHSGKWLSATPGRI